MVPETNDPTMTVEAPADKAFTISPEFFNPPSAITGIPCGLAIETARAMAVN